MNFREKQKILRDANFPVNGDRRLATNINPAYNAYLAQQQAARQQRRQQRLANQQRLFTREANRLGQIEPAPAVQRNLREREPIADVRLRNRITRHLQDVINNGIPFNIVIQNRRMYLTLLDVVRTNFLGQRLNIEFPNGSFRALNELAIDNLVDALTAVEDEEDTYYYGLVATNFYGETFTIRRFERQPRARRQVRREGGFVKYLHNLDMDLSKYQIFTEFDPKNYKNNCLYDALKNYEDLTEVQLNIIKTNVKNRNIAKCDLADIAVDMGITIKLHEYKSNSTSTNQTYKNKGHKEYNIALYEDHYFTYEAVNIKIGKKSIKTSLALFKYLFDNKDDVLTEIEVYDLNKIGYDTTEITTLEYDHNQILKINDVYHNSEINCSKNNLGGIYFADFECFINQYQKPLTDEEKRKKKKPITIRKHYPYQLGFESLDKEDFTCYNYAEGVRMSCLMLDSICRKNKDKSSDVDRNNLFLIYCHNAKYDTCFFDFDKMYELNFTIKDGVFYEMKFTYYFQHKPYKFAVRDSLKHLPFALSKFPSKFDMPDKFKQKEIIPYSFYTLENIKKRFCYIEDAVADLRKYKFGCNNSDIEQFTNNIDKWGLRDGELFDIIAYSQKYNELDVKILKQGLKTWRQQVLDFTDNNLDIYHILTSASLAQKYFEIHGAYKNIFKINQTPRKFIQHSVYGGRCMSRLNKKYLLGSKPVLVNGKVTNINNYKTRVQDFDAVSLYPSAIRKLKELGGILKGLPKVIPDDKLNMDFLNKCDGYFVEIQLESMKQRQFPLVPIREDGVLVYDTEKLINKVTVVGKIQLEDLIKYGDCKFKILKGYYYNDGRDDKICEIILSLFEKRLEYKKQGNALQEVIKLIMNSAYGKTIMKAADSKLSCKRDKLYKNKKGNMINDFENYVDYNYDKIKQYTPIADSANYLVETYINVNDHYSMPHVGSEILAMSKRIMNEVMCLAEDNSIDIYYQDTDSMHILEKDVETLAKLFKDKYGRELIGKNMGQFHCDFDSEKIKGNIFAIYSIILGKKSYMDVLANDNGDIDYHIRMKGIPNDSIIKYCDNNQISIVDLYEKLYNGEKINFDLTCDQQKPKFEIKHFTTSTKLDFAREIKFI